MKKVYIKKLEDIIDHKWKTQECSTKDCWCEIITTVKPTYVKDEKTGNEHEAYVAGSGAIPKELARHIVKVHNHSLELRKIVE